jgi:hypothetical protein
MLPFGIGLAWLGYTVLFWGRSLVKGWNLSFADIASPTKFYTGQWPPLCAPCDEIIPTGKSAGVPCGTPCGQGTGTTAQVTSTTQTTGGGVPVGSFPGKRCPTGWFLGPGGKCYATPASRLG